LDLQNLILVEFVKNSNLVGLKLEWYYFVLAPVGTPKNQFNKYFHTIFSPGGFSVDLISSFSQFA
jgi:hypothetical protein